MRLPPRFLGHACFGSVAARCVALCPRLLAAILACSGGGPVRRLERHIFVCENRRPDSHPRGCCAARGGSEVRARLKALIGDSGLAGSVRANQSGCLDRCEQGVTVVIYPEGVWYGGVTVDDVGEIFERHVLRGEVVQRLRIDSGEAADS